jgi:hypothetical protein
MRLTEILSYADISQLHQLANTYSCQCNVNSKNELIQSLLTTIKRDSKLLEQLHELKQEEMNFLLSLIFDARSTFSLEDLRAKAKISHLTDSDQEIYRGLVTIALRKGWIYRIVSRNVTASFEVPEDMKRQWAKVILKNELYRVEPQNALTVYRDEGHALASDVQVFLRYVENHEPPLTNEGVIYRKNQQQLMELMSVQEELVVKGEGWRFGYGRYYRDYPARFSLLHDYCFYRNYISIQPGEKLQLMPQAQEASQLPVEIHSLELYKFWIRVYKHPIPGLATLIRMICYAADAGWVEESSLLHLIVPRVRPYYYDKEEDIVKKRILKMLIHLGLLRVGEFGNEHLFYQTTPWGQRTMELVETSKMQPIVFSEK